MANKIQIKRGNAANRTSIVPAEGELIYLRDSKALYIGDGVTPGGVAPTNFQAAGSYALAGHTHSYLPLSGGTLTGDLYLGNKAYSQTKGGWFMNHWNTNPDRGVAQYVDENSGESIVWFKSVMASSPTSSPSQNTQIKLGRADGGFNQVYHQGYLPSLAELGAAASSHTHSYLPLSGGILTGALVGRNHQESLYIGDGAGDYGAVGMVFRGHSTQHGYFYANHQNADSQGAAYSFHFGSTETSTNVILDGGGNFMVGSSAVYHEGHKPTPAEIGAQPAGSYLPLTGGTLSGELGFPQNNVVNREFQMIENAGTQYILLCLSAGNNDVNGRIHMDRSSGNHQAVQLDVVVSANSSAMIGGMLTARQVKQNNEDYSLVKITYDSKAWVAIKYTGNAYPETTGCWFTGRLNSTDAAALTVVSTGVSGEVALGGVTEYAIKAASVTINGAEVSTSAHGHTGLGVSAWGGIKSVTSSGYIEFGPANTSHAHIYTDRPNFYFNKPILVSGVQLAQVDTSWDFTKINGQWVSNQNVNSYEQGRFYGCSVGSSGSSLGAPGTYSYVVNLGGSGSAYGLQLAAHYGTGKYLKFRRRSDNAGSENGANAWQPWYDIYHSGNKPTAADVGAATSSHNHDGRYAWYDHFRCLGSVYLTDSATTASFIAELEAKGAFDSFYTVMKCAWSYAGNSNLDTGIGTLELAGSVIECWTDNSSDSTRGNITVRVTRPNTGTGAYAEYVYNDQGSSYSPGWRKVYNSRTPPTYSEVGAAAASHSHSYLPLAGGTLTGKLHADGGIQLGTDKRLEFDNSTTYYMRESTGSYGTVAVYGRRNSWSGYSIEGRVCLMHDGGSASGLYNDVNNEWLVLCYHGGATHLYYDGTSKLYTSSGGGYLSGTWVCGDMQLSSDVRRKENFAPIDNALEKALAIGGYLFDWKETGERSAGIKAQELQAQVPEAVTEDDEGYLTVNPMGAIGVLFSAINELAEQVKELKEAQAK